LLTSEWREEEKRNKRFYRISAEGQPILDQLLAEWRAIDAALTSIDLASDTPAAATGTTNTATEHKES
jgi:DNA-binding PadR family transcriptional regulator